MASKKNNVLIVPDLHLPATHKHALDFCVDIYNKYKCNKVVFIGDIVDHHAISKHAKNPNCPSAADEYERTWIDLRQWSDTFPEAIVTIGNHDHRPTRMAAEVNIPEFYLKSFSEVWDTPGWEWVYDVVIDKVYYFHGSGGGKVPALNKAVSMGMSCVMGHTHSVAGVHWGAGPLARWFGMDVGCLIDREAFQFSYGKHCIRKPFLSCGVVTDGVPYHEVMKLEEYSNGK